MGLTLCITFAIKIHQGWGDVLQQKTCEITVIGLSMGPLNEYFPYFYLFICFYFSYIEI